MSSYTNFFERLNHSEHGPPLHENVQFKYAVYRWACVHLQTYLPDIAPYVAPWNELRDSDEKLTDAIYQIYLNGSLPKLAEFIMQKCLDISYCAGDSEDSLATCHRNYTCTISELEKLLVQKPNKHQPIVNNPPVFSSRRDRERPSSHRRRSRSSSSSSSPDRSIRRHTAPRRRRPPPSAEQEEQIKREAHSRSTFYILASLIKYYHIGMENSAAETSKSNKRNTEYRGPDSVYSTREWANMMTHGVDDGLEPATNLSTDWNDGKRLFALVKSFGLSPDDITLSPQCDAIFLTTLAMNMAVSDMDIPVAKDLYDAEKDFCVPEPSQEIVWIYLALFFGKKGSPAEKFVLNWVNRIIPNADVAGFSADWWNDGRYLYLLVDKLSHGKLTADTMSTYGYDDVNSLAMRCSSLRIIAEGFMQTYLDEKLKKKDLLFPNHLQIGNSLSPIKCDSFRYMLHILAIKLNFEKADPSLRDLGKRQNPDEFFIESLRVGGIAQEKTNEPNESKIKDLEKQLESSTALTKEEIKQLNEDKHMLEEKMVNQEKNLIEKDEKIEEFKKQLESSTALTKEEIKQLNEDKHMLEEKMVNQEKNLIEKDEKIEEFKKQLESSTALTTKQQEEIQQLIEDKHKLEEKMVDREQNLNEKDEKIEEFKKQLESSEQQEGKIELLIQEKHELEKRIDNQEQTLNVSDMYEIMHALAGLEKYSKSLGEEVLKHDAKLDEIIRNINPTRDLYNVLRYWIVKERLGTPNSLVCAINDMELGEPLKGNCVEKVKAIGKSNDYTILLLDTSKVNDVAEVTKYDIFSRVDWRVLGMLLGLDDGILEEIENSCTTDGDRQSTMIQRWINTKKSYWELLVKALDSPVLSMKTLLADKIAKENLNLNALKAREDNLPGAACPYPVNEAEKEKKKEDIIDYLSNHPPNGQSKLNGVVFILGMTDVAGVEKDMMHVHDVFTTLNFTTMRVFNPTGSELALFVKAASEIDFKDLSGGNCKQIVFHFSGHGGIDDQKRAYFVGKSIIPIQDSILSFFENVPAGDENFIFFFDICLSNQQHSFTQDDLKCFHIYAPLRCVVAFATSVGTKAWGDDVNGGKWTRHLCMKIKNNPTMELGELLERAHTEVVNESTEYGKKQLQAPFFESCAGPIHFKELTVNDKNGHILNKHSEKLKMYLAELPELRLAELIIKLRERNKINKNSFDIDEIRFPGKIKVAKNLLKDFRKVPEENLEDICCAMKEAHNSALSELAEQIVKDLKSKADQSSACTDQDDLYN